MSVTKWTIVAMKIWYFTIYNDKSINRNLIGQMLDCTLTSTVFWSSSSVLIIFKSSNFKTMMTNHYIVFFRNNTRAYKVIDKPTSYYNFLIFYWLYNILIVTNVIILCSFWHLFFLPYLFSPLLINTSRSL